MATSLINVGSSPNDGTGDPIRDAFNTVNDRLKALFKYLMNLAEYHLS